MIVMKEMPAQPLSDAELVAKSLAGNHHAFREIVERYQTLICSLAYCATGSISQSEDLAQETFVKAWEGLAELREPSKLRSWLCGIVRFRIGKQLRKQGREPVHAAEPMEAMDQAAAVEALPSDQAITNEEKAILWRSLERIPKMYREPLVLFYRKHQSVEVVAQNLELSEDAVRQRLSRGRKMLQEQMLAFVEGALERTTPGKGFTLGVVVVVSALGSGSTASAAATLGRTVVKAGTASKVASVAGLAGALLGPAVGVLGGAYGASLSIKNARSLRERQFMIRQTRLCLFYILLFLAALSALLCFRRSLVAISPVAFGSATAVLAGGYIAGLLIFVTRSNRRQQQIRLEEGTDETREPQQWQSLNRSQQFWAVYGSLGGSTAGALAWIVIRAATAKDWITALGTVLFAVAVVMLGGRAWLRNPACRLRVLLQTLALVAVFTLVICLVHGRAWFAKGDTNDGRTPTRQCVAPGSKLSRPGVMTDRQPCRSECLNWSASSNTL
jgi:RNA polymerase sigma factor (sigma-70 family)